MPEEGNYHFIFKKQKLILSPLKAIFWQNERILIISDVHLGKAHHFRKSGIAVPQHIHAVDLEKIECLLSMYMPDTVIFLGDLFHSDVNVNWDEFNGWLEEQLDVQFILVRGNHDVLPDHLYESSTLVLVDEYTRPPFTFSHEPVESKHYNITGHVHPAIKLRGRARQSVSLPCFHFGNDTALMPAFGEFTGFVKVGVRKTDHIFTIAPDKVIKITKD